MRFSFSLGGVAFYDLFEWGQCKNLRGNICKNPIFA